jgi:hypothetical protein
MTGRFVSDAFAVHLDPASGLKYMHGGFIMCVFFFHSLCILMYVGQQIRSYPLQVVSSHAGSDWAVGLAYGDLCGDGTKEVILGTRDGFIEALHIDIGQLKPATE